MVRLATIAASEVARAPCMPFPGGVDIEDKNPALDPVSERDRDGGGSSAVEERESCICRPVENSGQGGHSGNLPLRAPHQNEFPISTMASLTSFF